MKKFNALNQYFRYYRVVIQKIVPLKIVEEPAMTNKLRQNDSSDSDKGYFSRTHRYRATVADRG
ncbi:hypothetical protein SD53_14440 [Rheinheimera mesophila]|nr:hypothetical protein SD53_14440 [Rheinheimera mesophila]